MQSWDLKQDKLAQRPHSELLHQQAAPTTGPNCARPAQDKDKTIMHRSHCSGAAATKKKSGSIQGTIGGCSEVIDQARCRSPGPQRKDARMGLGVQEIYWG